MKGELFSKLRRVPSREEANGATKAVANEFQAELTVPS
jgi:hypothetical protein